MNISPNTKIVICQDVPLDNTYEHTIHFGYAREYQHLADQYNYFYSKKKYEFEPTTYQRVNSNTLRIQMIADNLYNCNYLMFQNTNFRTETTHYTGDKWFYAFITSVNYINNAVTEITYEIDVMQTWMFDYILSTAYVERQHSGTDAIGDNLIPEPIVPTSFVTYDEAAWPYVTDVLTGRHRKAMVLANKMADNMGNLVLKQVRNVNGIPCRVLCQIYDMVTQKTDFENLMTAYDGVEDRIIGIYSVPPVFSYMGLNTDAESALTYNGSLTYPSTSIYGGTFDGYTPKNNKMYTYPFNKLKLQNSFGQEKEYKFELFEFENNGAIEFTSYAAALPKPSLILFPTHYAGNVGNIEDALSMGDYPEGAITGDSFQMWLHQGFVQDLASVGTGGISLAYSAGNKDEKGNPDRVGRYISARNLFSTTLNMVAHGIQAGEAPNPLYGNLESKSAYYGHPSGFSFKLKTERPVYSQAKMIDDFLTRFGYAQNRIMTVDTYTRTHWTYTKTVDCTIKGSVPADDMAKIRDIFNSGITWWVNPSEIGDFTLNNAPRY